MQKLCESHLNRAYRITAVDAAALNVDDLSPSPELKYRRVNRLRDTFKETGTTYDVCKTHYIPCSKYNFFFRHAAKFRPKVLKN